MGALFKSFNLVARRVSFGNVENDVGVLVERDGLTIGNFVTLRSSTKDFLPSASEFLDGDDKCVVPWHFLEGE